MTPSKPNTRRLHHRTGASWTVWLKAGDRQVRHHTVDISAHGAKLRPRGTLQPGTPVRLLIHPPQGPALDVSAVVWRVDGDGVVVLFLGGIPAHLTEAKGALAVAG